MERKNRNHAFDLLCGVCIVRMLVLHIMNFCGHAQDAWWQGVMAWTYYFMCFFFFKSGYFNRGVGGPTGPYLKAKTLRLFVPYLAAGLIGDAIYFSLVPFLIHRYHHPVEPLSWSHIWEEGQFYGNCPVWFLCTFYFTYVAVHFIEKVPRLRYAFFLFPALSWWFSSLGNPLWLGLDNLFMGIFCFYLGHFWHRLMMALDRRRTVLLSLLLVAVFCLLNACTDTCYTMSSNAFKGPLPWLVVSMACALCGLSGLLVALEVPRV
ncbi:MAG: acyltransferase family protein, partial [Bacteroidaceae bacterium]